MIKNIVFDMGGVIMTFDQHLFISRLGVAPEDEKLLMNTVFKSLEWAQMDRGSLLDEDAAKIFCSRTPERLHDAVYKLATMWDRPILPIKGMEELIRELKANGYHIFLLSNASTRQHEYWPRVPVSDCFEDTLISADYRLVKPQPEIYRAAYEKFGILPEESVFIDDTPINAEGAVNTGMDAFVFHGETDELRCWLISKGVKL